MVEETVFSSIKRMFWECVSARKFSNMDGQGINTKSIAVQHVYYHENPDRKVSSYEERNIMLHNSTNYGYNRRI